MGNENTNNFFSRKEKECERTAATKTGRNSEKHEYKSNLVIAIMQDVQKEYHYLPEEALCYIAKELKMSEAKIYGVATFYENFSLEPRVNLSLKYVTVQHAMYENQCRFWKSFVKRLGLHKKSLLLMICFLLLKRYLVWEPVVWHRYVR